jgi:hypothetical protein
LCIAPAFIIQLPLHVSALSAILNDAILILIISSIIILITTFMQGMYSYIPETNNVSRTYNFAAVLYLRFVLHVMLFRT